MSSSESNSTSTNSSASSGVAPGVEQSAAEGNGNESNGHEAPSDTARDSNPVQISHQRVQAQHPSTTEEQSKFCLIVPYSLMHLRIHVASFSQHYTHLDSFCSFCCLFFVCVYICVC
jgi:hypothetical protein